MASHRFRALTTDVELSGPGPQLAAIAADLLACYPPAAGPPALTYRLDESAHQLRRGDQLLRESGELADLAGAFEIDLYQQVVAACTDGFVLHAAGLRIGGRALVLAGASGAGKTTLALRLLARGADYLTEECALVRADGTVLGLPRPITRLPDDDGPLPPGLVRREVRQRLADGRLVRRALLVPSADRVCTTPAPLAAIVAIRRDAAAETLARRASGVEALGLLQGLSMSSGPGPLRALIAAAATLPVHELRSRSPYEAIAALEEIFSRLA